MKETVVNQLLSGARAEMKKVVLSESYKQEYLRFEANCKEFKKKIEEKGEGTPDMLELFDKTIQSFLSAYRELAECHFDAGFRTGFQLSKEIYFQN